MTPQGNVRTKAAVPDTTTSSELRNYRLEQQIGRDELATVYAAMHLMLDRPVQVHILRRTDWVSASRFQLAARLAGKLSHPNLLPVIDAGHDDQFGDYLVTPTLDARPLVELLHEGALEPVQGLRIATQVAAALDYLHSQKVIHRDVQPANVLITSQGVAYLTNLSLASSPDTPDLSSVDEADYLTAYSAPEQHLEPTEVSPTLDVYGLGAMIFHMLSGDMPPPPGTPLPPIGVLIPALSQADPVLRRMMADQPEERYPTPGAAITALRQALRNQIDAATDDMEESRWEVVAEWLENPLETVLSKVLEDQVAREQAEGTTSDAGLALSGFQNYLSKSHTRADSLHRADTIRRLLNRWSRQGFFRRQMLGQLIELEQIVSYNIYFYDLRALYETRTEPEKRQRIARMEDRPATLTPPDVWEALVPAQTGFTAVQPQDLVLPNSTNVFTCTTCGGNAEVTCPTCSGSGMVERTRRVRNPDNSTTTEAFSEQCPTCHGYGKQRCPTCEGNGNLVEEEVFTWSRRARLFQNTDDIEALPPQRVLEGQAAIVCTTNIDVYQGHWHSVAPLDELLRVAIGEITAPTTRLIMGELTIRAIPVTEVEFKLNERSQVLYLLGDSNEVYGTWQLYNPERVALIIVGLLLLIVLSWFLWQTLA